MRLIVLNTDSKECTYGGVAPIMLNMHPYLASAFDLQYIVLPGSWKRLPGPNRLKTLLYLFMHMRTLRKADVILSHIIEGSVVASLLHIPYAHIYHGNSNPMSVSRYKFGHFFTPMYNHFLKRIEKTATLRYSVGPASGDVRKLMNPISHDVSALPVEDRSGFIYSGRLESGKNIDRIIRVYSQLSEEIRSKNDLFIVGSGSVEESLKSLAKEMSLENRVHFLGRLPNRDLIAEDARHSLFLMASLVEGMPTAIAEALSVGVPVVTTDAGDISSVVKSGYNGYVLPPDCSDSDFRIAIEKALSNLQELSLNALESSKIFNAACITNKLINDLYAIG